MDGLDKGTVRTVDGYRLWVVDVVDDDVALRSCDDSSVVAHAKSRRLDVGEDSVLQDDGDGVRQQSNPLSVTAAFSAIHPVPMIPTFMILLVVADISFLIKLLLS